MLSRLCSVGETHGAPAPLYGVTMINGEVFYFNTNDVTDAKSGWGAGYTYSYHVTDTEGTPRVITSRSEAWLKCVEKDGSGASHGTD